MKTLLHCGKRRMPFKRVDIYPPKQMLYADKQWVDPSRFETMAVFEFQCAGCFKARGQQSVFGWVGYPFSPNEQPTALHKIPNRHVEKWLGWMRHNPVVGNRSGVWTVQGSERQWPYRFNAKISIR